MRKGLAAALVAVAAGAFAARALAADVTGPAAAISPASPIIDVYGYRRERVAPERPGQSVTIRPEDPSRFDTTAQLTRDSALAVPETGRITAGGFALPRIRGQDLRLTEIWVEDFQLADPFTGLPLVDELDLRAFGELSLHQGVTPPELATVSPAGVVQYRLRPVSASRLTLGSAFGKPFGHSLYILGESLQRGVAPERPHDQQVFSARAYARQHRTDGRYSYYDDAATPYASGDDRTLTRESNDRLSRAALPAVRYAAGADEVRAMALWQDAGGGLPAPSSRVPSRAEQKATANFASLRWRRAFATDSAELALTTGEDQRRATDLDGSVLGERGEHRVKVETRRVAARGRWHRDRHDTYLDVEGARARVKTRGSGDDLGALERRSERVYVGSAVQLPFSLLVEAKAEARRLVDRRTANGTAPLKSIDAVDARERHRTRDAFGGSLALGWLGGAFAPYAQAAALDRPPTLLEEYGDGSGVRASPGIAAEKARHLEIGLRAGGLTAAIFLDTTTDRIVLIPSLGQTVRAQNVGVARVRGGTVAYEGRFGRTEPFVGGTLLEPLDRTLPDRPRVLPGVAEKQAALGVAQGAGKATVRWTSRYRSRVFRDARNEIETPASWQHDLAVDASTAVAHVTLRYGLLVANLTNVTSAKVAARGEHQDEGVTGVADYAGAPLPGRQVKLWVEAEL